MDIYLHDIRAAIKPTKSKELECRFFLTQTGNELANLSEAISKVTEKWSQLRSKNTGRDLYRKCVIK